MSNYEENGIEIDGLDEIEVENTAVDDLESESINLIFLGIDESGSMTQYIKDMQNCLTEFKTALTDSKEADEILVARADFSDFINIGGYKKECIEEWEVSSVGRKYIKAGKRSDGIWGEIAFEYRESYKRLVEKTDCCVDYILYLTRKTNYKKSSRKTKK